MKLLRHPAGPGSRLRRPAGAGTETECIVPSKPGGAMDLTCKLAKKALLAQPEARRMKLSYHAGRDRRGGLAHAGVAARAPSRTRWSPFPAARCSISRRASSARPPRTTCAGWPRIGADYGMIAVGANSPYHNLRELFDAIRRDAARRADRRLGHHRQPGLAEDGAAGAARRDRPEAAALRGAGGRRRKLYGDAGGLRAGDLGRRLRSRACTRARARCASWPCWRKSACPAV